MQHQDTTRQGCVCKDKQGDISQQECKPGFAQCTKGVQGKAGAESLLSSRTHRHYSKAQVLLVPTGVSVCRDCWMEILGCFSTFPMLELKATFSAKAELLRLNPLTNQIYLLI